MSEFRIEDAALSDAVVRALEKLHDSLKPPTALARYGVPMVVKQAMDNAKGLPPAARLVMWHLQYRLNFLEFVEVKAESLATDAGIKETTAGQMLTLLVKRGYLEESAKKKPRAFRMPWSQRTSKSRAA